ncbi:tyrosine-type recombinase/integrase [Halorubrum kocurii]|uniref:Phage integrase/site-specific recombinase n=1 Tax=Halorubrum kocurii JCM 14978 TaxID=1230456 RepID=M0NP86_9EURY|nr:tyrosine-type recombinase/integrase [Halorubrum kocurii]EMA59772.1 phage integrase/site-specific recombinase [Halorubrum kocurii JCM 14978]
MSRKGSSPPANPSDLSPRQARDRFLEKRSMENSAKTIRSYNNRLTRWVHWCEERGVERVGDLSGWLFDEYERHLRAEENAPATVKGKMTAVSQVVQYLATIEAVDEDLPEKVHVPKLTRSQETSDTMLDTEDAKQLLEFYRNDPARFGTPPHAVLEVFWNTGCRLGAVVGLDLADYDPENGYLDFNHRPESGTPLKNNEQGERVVRISEPVVDALDTYIARERSDKRDEYGREPLFAGRQGRVTDTTIRSWTYQGTQPCLYMECPHGRRRRNCKFTERSHASKCPSSRAPHHIRTGSLTWHCDRGLPIEVISERVDADPDTIKRYYDKADRHRKMAERREEYTADLDIAGIGDEEDDS